MHNRTIFHSLDAHCRLREDEEPTESFGMTRQNPLVDAEGGLLCDDDYISIPEPQGIMLLQLLADGGIL